MYATIKNGNMGMTGRAKRKGQKRTLKEDIKGKRDGRMEMQ